MNTRTLPAFRIKKWAYVPLLIAAIAGIWLSADGRMHWDEPTYLYAGHYLSTGEILAGEVQPSGIPGFTHGRILHALLTKGVMSSSASGPAGFRAMVGVHFVLTIVNLLLIAGILRGLLPHPASSAVPATVLLAMSPIVLYMMFKTLADNESLIAALIATFALLRGAKGGSAGLVFVAAAGLAVSALTKNQLIVMPAAFWAALCLAPIGGVNRRRLAVFGIAAGVAGFLLTVAILELLGLGIHGYLASYGDALVSSVPFVANIVNVGTEFGLLWLLLPLALLTSQRRHLLAFGLWFAFATLPMILVFPSIEARHLAGNLVAAGGLIALALEAICSRFESWQQFGDWTKTALGIVVVIAVMAINALALAIMPHRVDIRELETMVAALDDRYGAERYALLTARGYTDFHLIRVLWPRIDVLDVGASAMEVNSMPQSRESALDAYMGHSHPDSIAQLAALDKPLVYLGYRHTFAAANMRTILSVLSPEFADRLLGSVTLVDHLFPPETEWLWGSDEVRFDPIEQKGHYLAFKVSLGAEESGAIGVEDR